MLLYNVALVMFISLSNVHLLFIVYINDLPEISKLAKFLFFADDANIIMTGTTMIEIQEQASLLLKWLRSNGMRKKP